MAASTEAHITTLDKIFIKERILLSQRAVMVTHPSIPDKGLRTHLESLWFRTHSLKKTHPRISLMKILTMNVSTVMLMSLILAKITSLKISKR